MLFRLKDYSGGFRIASLAKSREVAEDLLNNGLDVIAYSGDKAILLPDNYVIAEETGCLKHFAASENYDVFELDRDGTVYRSYSNESSDNVMFITGACNSNCVMCPSPEAGRRHAGISGLDKLLLTVNHIPEYAEHITITGGEPMLLGRKMFVLLESMRNKFSGTEFLFLSNGRAFSLPGYASAFVSSAPRRTIVAVPLHGYDSVTHDAVTRSSGSFVQTMAGLKELRWYGANIEIRIVVSKITAPYVDKIADLIINELPDILRVRVIALEMLGNAAINSGDVWLSYPESFSAAKEAILRIIDAGIEVGLYGFPLCSVDADCRLLCAQGITDYKVRFADSCKSCAVHDACGGIFAGTFRYAAGDVHPIKESIVD